MDWNLNPLAEALKIFKTRIELYFEDQDIVDEEKKATNMKK